MNLEQLHSDYKDDAAQLADVRERYQIKQAELQERIRQVETAWSNENAELIQELQTQTDVAASKESLLRDAIKAAYIANPTSKTVAPGLSVQIRTKLVYDKEQALQWAKEHGLALALDAKTFEKHASVQPLEFVTTQQSIVAVIGK